MKVNVAGFNLDISLISQLTDQKTATPESISAAYARISRSPLPVDELRKLALQEIEKARKSNQNIIFEMGHSSVAEHAVFNLDLIGISRLLTEIVERSRLASFTEKSQRYVTLKGDYVVPEEIRDTPLEADFRALIASENNLYSSLYKNACEYLQKTGFPGSTRELEGRAKEDARYVLSLATQTQLGMTINARNLAHLLRRLDASTLAEAQLLKSELEGQIKKIAPSLIRYTNASEYEKRFPGCLPDPGKISYNDRVELLGVSANPEDSILSSLFFEKYGYDVVLIMNKVKQMSTEEKEAIFNDLFRGMQSFHSVPRAFEVTHFTFQLTMSSSCFAQFKRHRLCTLLRSPYSPEQGYVIPPLIRELKREEEIRELMGSVHKLYKKMHQVKQGLGDYALTNAHKVSVIFQANLRELYHFSRLRSDCHAQWEIRDIARQVDEIVREKAPLAAKFIMGKDQFEASCR